VSPDNPVSFRAAAMVVTVNSKALGLPASARRRRTRRRHHRRDEATGEATGVLWNRRQSGAQGPAAAACEHGELLKIAMADLNSYGISA